MKLLDSWISRYLQNLSFMNEFMMSSPESFTGNLFDQYILIRQLTFAPKIFDLAKLTFKNQALIGKQNSSWFGKPRLF